MRSMLSVSLRTIVTSVFVLSSSCVFAQQSPVSSTVRVRGTVENLDGETLRIKSREGAEVAMHLPAKALVSGVVKTSLADVKVGSYIGVTSVPDSSGGQKAVEVHIFPEAMRGVGDGSRPWDLKPNSSMTNGAVDDRTVTGNDGHTLTVKYKGGERKVQVTPETEVVSFVPGTRADVTAGAKVFVIATKQADGSLEAGRISVGRDGLAPPM